MHPCPPNPVAAIPAFRRRDLLRIGVLGLGPSAFTLPRLFRAVSAKGVAVTLSPSSAVPGSPLVATVTNTGRVADTYSLALGGPAALVATLGRGKVSLAPGASTRVAIGTGAVNHADPGSLPLMLLATSTTEPTIRAEAASSLAIPPTVGFSSALSPASRVLARPAATIVLVVVDNTGNTEDDYQVVIAGTKGPAKASLVGLDGSPAGAIPLFRLPGLSSTAVPLVATLTGPGTGQVIVQVKSLSTGRFMNLVETIHATTPSVTPTTTHLEASPVGPGATAPVILTATVTPAAAIGSVILLVDGKPIPMTVALTRESGRDVARLTLPGLSAGSHTFQTRYDGSASYAASSSPLARLTITPPNIAAAPRVTNVWRMGYHDAPTTLFLGFDRPLSPAAADNPDAYTIVGPGGRRIAVTSAHYDEPSETVTLSPSQRLNLHWTYRLIVAGSGPLALLGADGLPLDGLGNGRPGSDYVTTITMANWTLVPPPPLLQSVDPPEAPAKRTPAGPLALARPSLVLR